MKKSGGSQSTKYAKGGDLVKEECKGRYALDIFECIECEYHYLCPVEQAAYDDIYKGE